MIIEQIYTGCLAQGAYYIESDGEGSSSSNENETTMGNRNSDSSTENNDTDDDDTQLDLGAEDLAAPSSSAYSLNICIFIDFFYIHHVIGRLL